MRRYRLRKSRDRATTRSRWRWSTAKQELTSSARLLNPWDLLKDDPNPHAPEGLVAGEMAFARNPVHVTNEGVGVLREVDGCSRQLPGAEHAGGIEWHDELTDHIAQRGEENLHRRARGDPVLVHASAVRGKGLELVVTGDVFGSGFERVRAGDRRNDGDGKKAGQLLHTALRGLAPLCAVPTQKAKRRSTGQQQQGAVGEPSTHRASLLNQPFVPPLPTGEGDRGRGLRRLRRLTTTHLRLRVRPDWPHHAVNAGPRAHQLGIVAEPIAHDAVQHLHLLGDLGHYGPGNRPPPPCPEGPARLLRASSRTR